MSQQLTKTDCEQLLESLGYAQLNYESTQYPSEELRKQQFERLDHLRIKLRAIRDATNSD